MSYLKDYLKVIPKVEADKIRENITKNKEIFEVKRLNDDEFNALLTQLSDEQVVQTKPIALDQKVLADDLNAFYSNVALDLARLFPEQNHIEQAGENYDRIYQGHLEELKQEIDNLTRVVEELEEKHISEQGLVLKHYSFEPEQKGQVVESLNTETAHLFTDRDGSPLKEASMERLFHTYFLSLHKETDVNVLINNKGLGAATLELLYESPYTVSHSNEFYSLDKAIDANSDTFWFTTALKPSNSMETVSIKPKREERA